MAELQRWTVVYLHRFVKLVSNVCLYYILFVSALQNDSKGKEKSDLLIRFK